MVFKRLNSLWGPMLVDLFATRISKQLPRYFSWKPDPYAEAINAFAQVWSDFRGFAKPPWSLIGRCIQHIKKQKATIVLITPLWPSQPWFAALPPLCLDQPRVLPPWTNLMIPAQGTELPFPEPRPRLVAWLVSGDTTRPQGCQRVPQGSYSHYGDPQLTRIMTSHGIFGRDGVQSTIETLFLPL